MHYIYTVLFILWSNFALASHALVVVDGKAITSMDVSKRIEALKLANPEISPDDGMKRHILNNLISEELFHNEAKRLKVSVTKKEIEDHFKEISQNHGFSKDMLLRLSSNESLRKQVESQILWNKLIGLVLYNKIKVSDAEVRDEQKIRKGEIREVTFKQIVFDSFDSDKIRKITNRSTKL